MELIGHGVYDDVKQQVDPTHGAARVSLRPPETGLLGSYRMSLKSGVIAAGMSVNLPIWEMRWGSSQAIAIVRKVRMQAVVSTTNFNSTAADSSFSLYRAQGFTALDTTNGTVAAWTKGKAQAVATRMTSSQLAGDSTTTRTSQGGIVIINTSASGLTGGTKTLDDQPIATVLGRIAPGAATLTEAIITPEPPPYLIDPAEGPTGNPVELNANEGLVLQTDAITTVGTWRLMVDVAWDEVDPARYFG